MAYGLWLMAYGLWLLAFGFWLLAFGFWLLAFGFWLLAFGFWLLAFGFWIAACSLRFRTVRLSLPSPGSPQEPFASLQPLWTSFMSPILRRRDHSGELGDFLPSEDRLACVTKYLSPSFL
jgi:hypothetical protein